MLDALRVLVTGASGFIGSHLVDSLIGAGARVTAVCCDIASS
jgi:nucleoside-diphosphate-sugar epimerase